MNRMIYPIAGLGACLLLAISMLASCKDSEAAGPGREITVAFDAQGGTPVPPAQKVSAGGKIAEPTPEPAKEGEAFIGWYTKSGLKFNFKNSTADEDMTLYAKWWNSPEQYIFINDYDWSCKYNDIKSYFGISKGRKVAVGQSFILYCFERTRDQLEKNLRAQLAASLASEIPLLVQMDAITFWDAAPELWNWWDANQAGYDPQNRENVEWTSWSSDDAVKIGWLNWGSQIRLKPMANVMSPRYRAAVKERMGYLIRIVMDWYEALPADKKYLFAGIKVTGEMALGVNNWYYPDGNSYLDKPASADPKTGINVNDFPSRGVQTIGYAALKTAGIKTSGEITAADIAEVERRHIEFCSQIAAEQGVPRERIFAHAGGAGPDLAACLNRYASPAWSFYSKDATHPAGFTEAVELMQQSDAPYFGIAEWAIGANESATVWSDAIREGLSMKHCRFLSIYTNVIANNNGMSVDMNAVNGIKALLY